MRYTPAEIGYAAARVAEMADDEVEILVADMGMDTRSPIARAALRRLTSIRGRRAALALKQELGL